MNDKVYNNILKENHTFQVQMKYESILSGVQLIKQFNLKSKFLCSLFLHKTYLILYFLQSQKDKKSKIINFSIKMSKAEEEKFFIKKAFENILNDSYDLQESIIFNNNYSEVIELISNEQEVIKDLLNYAREEIIVNNTNQLQTEKRYLKCLEILKDLN